MGWKLNMVVISGYKRGIDECSAEIGHNYHKRTYKKVGETNLENCLNPKDDEHLYIGEYKGLKIITEANLPFEFLTESKNLVEHIFSISTIIPTRSIHVLALNSVVNLWGYSVIQNNKRKRCKYGTHDNGLIHEEGEPLETEKELLSKSKIVNNKRRFNFNGDDYNEDQIGEEFIFRISENLFGERLDKSNSILDAKMYKFKCTEKEGHQEIIDAIKISRNK